MKIVDITEVARRSGVPASALRFYEEQGLIASIGRRGLRRLFDPGVLDQLGLIALARGVGFTLHEIALMFGPDGRPRIDRQMLADKADELDRTIRKLSAMRRSLRHAAACPAPSYMECPTFRRLLRAAASGADRERTSKAVPPTAGHEAGGRGPEGLLPCRTKTKYAAADTARNAKEKRMPSRGPVKKI